MSAIADIEAVAAELVAIPVRRVFADPNERLAVEITLHPLPKPRRVSLLNAVEDRAFARSYPRRRKPRDHQILRIQVDLELETVTPWVTVHGEAQEEVSEEESAELSIGTVPSEVERLIYELVVAANIAAPGTLEIGAGVIYQDGALYATSDPLISELSFIHEYASRTGWPALTRIELRQVWEWLVAGDYFEDPGRTPVSRAVNAFTHCFSSPGSTSPMTLFWALMGVEALFGFDAPGVRSVIMERAQLLLGRRDTFKTEFNELYQTRSAFVHGGLPFPGAFNPFEAEETTRFRDRVSRAQTQAEAILVSSLQHLIVRGWHRLEFTLSLRGTP